MTTRQFDILPMGRSSIDLYANDIGAPFHEIKSFAAYVGGCPTNISVGTRRLGLRSVLLTAVRPDPVGDFLLHFLNQLNAYVVRCAAAGFQINQFHAQHFAG